MKTVDLHVHTNASDGSCSPEEVIDQAVDAGLSAVAITDHDNERSCAAAAVYGKEKGIEVVPGIEISTKYGVSVHILGFFCDFNSPAIAAGLDWIVKDREERNRKVCDMLRADGIPVYYEEMEQRFGAVLGRPHFAQILMELGYVSSIAEGFKQYVGKGCKYFVNRHFFTIEQSVEMIASSGGKPVLAHPFQYKKNDEELRELIELCIDHGLQGMECRYSGYTKEQSDYLEALAKEYRLCRTGGSDFHGTRKPHISLGRGTGDLCVPYEFLEELKTHER